MVSKASALRGMPSGVRASGWRRHGRVGYGGAGFFTEACDRQGHKKEKKQIGADWKREGGEFSL